MAQFSVAFSSFNGGEIGKETQGRVTLENYGATAELLQNFFPEAAGPMTFRRGLKYLVGSPSNDFALLYPYFRRLTTKYLLMLTDTELRIVLDGGIVVRTAATSTIGDGDFSSFAAWTDDSTNGGSASVSGGNLVLTTPAGGDAIARQLVTTSSANSDHHLDITVTRGPVTFKVGSASGLDDYINETTLRTGFHRLKFTPTGSYWVEFSSALNREVLVDSITVAGAGDLVLPTPWAEADLRALRFEQSFDVMYVSSGLGVKKRIERRGDDSWSIVDSDERDGPFLSPNIDDSLTLTPSVRSGNGTLTASKNLFSSDRVGALWQLTQTGQFQTQTVSGEDQWSNPVKVTGIGTGRTITWTVAGTYVATVRLQRSVGNTVSWENVSGGTGTSSTTGTGSFTFADGQDNVIIYYRVGIAAGGFTSGSADLTISFTGGSTTGVARITAFTSEVLVDIEVLTPFAGTSATREWAEGAWSDFQGYPKAITTFDGRLWNGRNDQFWGSVSEAFESQAGGDLDADAISRSTNVGAGSEILWMLPLNRLIIGTEGGEVVPRSSALDEALNRDMVVRSPSTFGSSDIFPIKIDGRGIFLNRDGVTPMELLQADAASEYAARPLTRLNKNIGRPGILQFAVARQPDTRVFIVRSDGVCLVKLFDPGENLMGWGRIVTDGEIESVAVLPGDMEDEIYFMVKRTVDSSTVRYLEQLDPMFLDDVADANCLDSYLRYEGSAATNISGATHLQGRTVKVWANGQYLGTNVITAGGALTTPLSTAVTPITVGLSYDGKYKSSKLALGAQLGTALAQKGRPMSIALMLLNSVRRVEYGANFDQMDWLQDQPNDTTVETDGLIDEVTEKFAVPGGHSRDPRLCIRVTSPFPVTLQGYVIGMDLIERPSGN